MHVPLCDLARQAQLLRDELIGTIERVLLSGRYILGEEVKAFEKAISQYLGVRHAIGVASGTDALWLALKAVGVGPGDCVLTSPFTFFATISAILHAGARPVFVDIDPQTYNIDPLEVRAVLEGYSSVCKRLKIVPETIRAIIPVHLYGLPADMETLLEISNVYGLRVIEDAAQSLGAEYCGKKVGTFGDLGCFSFFPTKHLGALGDGGLIVTNDDEWAEQVRMLRAHGARVKHHHEIIGTNSRLDALQAAILQIKLKYVPRWISIRQRLAQRYTERLCDLPNVRVPQQTPTAVHTFHLYTICLTDNSRDRLRAFLKEHGIDTGVYYPTPAHLQPALKFLGYQAGDFPRAEQAARSVLSLPLFPEMTLEEQNHVVRVIYSFYGVSS